MPKPLAAFLPYGLAELPQVLERPRPLDRENLSAALTRYLTRIGAPQAALAAARSITHPESKVVVTGQQAGLLGGPSFTFYKAHTALKLAAEHHRQDRPVAAVFWVASQDHDTEEVRQVRMLDLQEKLHTLSLDLPAARPTGRIPFESFRKDCQEFVRGFGGRGEIEEKVIAALAQAENFAEAFARLLATFLGQRGLVVFDPMAPELARFFAKGIEQELGNPVASAEAINRTAKEMKQAGLEAGLGRPEGATNLFLEGRDGVRRLLRYHAGTFDDGLARYSEADLLTILREDPARITPGAGLRPVLQDTVLPTAGFVVGPSEMKYVAELGGVYRLHGLEPPAVIRRLSAVVSEPPIKRILDRYQLDPWDFQARPEAAFLAAQERHSQSARAIGRHLEKIEQEFAQIKTVIAGLDATLSRPLKRAEFRVSDEIKRLARKSVQAELRRSQVIASQFERLKLHLAPGESQERAYPFLMYILKFGDAILRSLEQLPSASQAVLEV